MPVDTLLVGFVAVAAVHFLVNMVGYAIGCLVFSRFSFSQADHASVRAELDARAAARAAPGTAAP